jgi:hypothetical protein
MTEAERLADAAEIAEEQRAFAYFHSLRKGSSTRAQRQAAWRRTQQILEKRERASWYAHPIKPAARWFDVMNESPRGWTYPGDRTLEDAEVDELFPGARAALVTQGEGLGPYRIVYDAHRCAGGRLKLSVPLSARHGIVTWLPEVGIWRRFTCGVSSRPRRPHMRNYDDTD